MVVLVSRVVPSDSEGSWDSQYRHALPCFWGRTRVSPSKSAFDQCIASISYFLFFDSEATNVFHFCLETFESFTEGWKREANRPLAPKGNATSIPTALLLMEDILHHLGWQNLVNNGINYPPINWRRISSINSMLVSGRVDTWIWAP